MSKGLRPPLFLTDAQTHTSELRILQYSGSQNAHRESQVIRGFISVNATLKLTYFLN
jgi:hypothetical protein